MAPKRKQAVNIETSFESKPAQDKPKKPRVKPPTVPVTDEQGWTAEPPSLIHKYPPPPPSYAACASAWTFHACASPGSLLVWLHLYSLWAAG